MMTGTIRGFIKYACIFNIDNLNREDIFNL
jgi:hypothetical protein